MLDLVGSGPRPNNLDGSSFRTVRNQTKQLGQKLVLYGSEPDQTTRTEERFVRFGTRPSPDQTTRCGALFKTARARRSTKSITSERSGTGNRARAGVLSKPQNLHPRAPSKRSGHARAPKASQMSVLGRCVEHEPVCCQNL